MTRCKKKGGSGGRKQKKTGQRYKQLGENVWEEYIETTGKMCIEVGAADGGVGVQEWE